jgi:hypothetical protein
MQASERANRKTSKLGVTMGAPHGTETKAAHRARKEKGKTNTAIVAASTILRRVMLLFVPRFPKNGTLLEGAHSMIVYDCLKYFRRKGGGERLLHLANSPEKKSCNFTCTLIHSTRRFHASVSCLRRPPPSQTPPAAAPHPPLHPRPSHPYPLPIGLAARAAAAAVTQHHPSLLRRQPRSWQPHPPRALPMVAERRRHPNRPAPCPGRPAHQGNTPGPDRAAAQWPRLLRCLRPLGKPALARALPQEAAPASRAGWRGVGPPWLGRT